jgi:quinol monooxygenase YgiN
MLDGRTDSNMRKVLAFATAVILAGVSVNVLPANQTTREFKAQQTGQEMFGLIGKMLAVPGKRDELIAILTDASSGMPGCLSYIVAKDSQDENALWVTEVWDSERSHTASLSLSSVKAAIAKGRPLIAGFGERFVTTPGGGYGLR